LLRHRVLPWLLRLIVGGVFVYAGLLKLRHPDAFADSIASFRLLPATAINVLALSLPGFEVLIGATVLVGRYRRAAALGVVIMTAAFAFALSFALAKGLQIECGCFGSESPSRFSTWFALGRDLLLLLAASALYVQAWSAASTNHG
jgi:uncharacterized membrane protein YphA (DoxX/SURF4 family)